MLFMKQEEAPFTFSIETTPSLPSRYCRFLARVLGWGLHYGNSLLAGIVWWQGDWFIALGAFLLGFVVFGIVRSKLHNDAIPPAQREYSYTDYAIATWYLSRYHCW